MSTTSAGSRWKCSRASSPVAASMTAQPSSSRASFTAVRMRSSSSTVRMRVPTAVTLCEQGMLVRCRPPAGRRGPARGRCGSAGRPAGRRRARGSGRGRPRRPGSRTGGRGGRCRRRSGSAATAASAAATRAARGPGIEEVGELEDHGSTSVRTVTGARRAATGVMGGQPAAAASAVRCRSRCDRVTGSGGQPRWAMGAIVAGAVRPCSARRSWRAGRAGRRRCPGRRPPRSPARRRSAVEVGHDGAGLGGDQATGGQVPRGQPPLVVGVDPAAGHRAQVDGGGARAADVAHLGEDLDEHLRPAAAARPARRRTRCRPARGRGRWRRTVGSAAPSRVAPRPRTAAEQLVADDVEHHARPPARPSTSAAIDTLKPGKP